MSQTQKFDVILEHQLVGMVPHGLVDLSINRESSQCEHCNSAWVDLNTFINVAKVNLDIPEFTECLIGSQEQGNQVVFLRNQSIRCSHKTIRNGRQVKCSMCGQNTLETKRIYVNMATENGPKLLKTGPGTGFKLIDVCDSCHSMAKEI